eukprot:Rmarinus@m.14065
MQSTNTVNSVRRELQVSRDMLHKSECESLSLQSDLENRLSLTRDILHQSEAEILELRNELEETRESAESQRIRYKELLRECDELRKENRILKDGTQVLEKQLASVESSSKSHENNSLTGEVLVRVMDSLLRAISAAQVNLSFFCVAVLILSLCISGF